MANNLQALPAYLREKQLLNILPFSSPTLWRKVRSGEFPAPIKFGPKITAWARHEVDAWLQVQEGQRPSRGSERAKKKAKVSVAASGDMTAAPTHPLEVCREG